MPTTQAKKISTELLQIEGTVQVGSGDKFTVDDTVMRGTSSITQPVRWLMNANHQGGKGSPMSGDPQVTCGTERPGSMCPRRARWRCRRQGHVAAAGRDLRAARCRCGAGGWDLSRAILIFRRTGVTLYGRALSCLRSRSPSMIGALPLSPQDDSRHHGGFQCRQRRHELPPA